MENSELGRHAQIHREIPSTVFPRFFPDIYSSNMNDPINRYTMQIFEKNISSFGKNEKLISLIWLLLLLFLSLILCDATLCFRVEKRQKKNDDSSSFFCFSSFWYFNEIFFSFCVYLAHHESERAPRCTKFNHQDTVKERGIHTNIEAHRHMDRYIQAISHIEYMQTYTHENKI